jgi:hypothetical protein
MRVSCAVDFEAERIEARSGLVALEGLRAKIVELERENGELRMEVERLPGRGYGCSLRNGSFTEQ